MLEPRRLGAGARGAGQMGAEALAPARPAILSVAVEIPSTRLTTTELAARLGVSEDWIVSRTGIRSRPVAAPDERLSEFAARAGSDALMRAGVDPADVDLVLVATLTQDELMPNAAPIVAHAVGADRAGAIDLGAACTGFLSGLSLAAAQIETGRAERVLLIGADFTTRIVDWDDKRTAPLFGDGVGAVVVGPAAGELGAIGPIILGADGSGAAAIHIDHDDRKLRMDGPEVYRHAVARMGEATLAAVEGAGLTLDDIDLFVYHQANGRILRALAEKLQLRPERVVDVIENLGNSSAATLPLGLAAAEHEGRLRPGARVLLSAFGAGFTWGAGVIEWGGSEDA
ncbi:MAG TPA: beta-ketoacyl-ACP synthase 3 [Solirubrobacteraceae bacterium]|nr:beta-ketoacyl-ACP synthase 3 [Solirubrobacteraceae bacterium]